MEDSAGDVVSELARYQAKRIRVVNAIGAGVTALLGVAFIIAGVVAIQSPSNSGGMGGRVIGAGIGFLVVTGMLVLRAKRSRAWPPQQGEC